MSDLEKKFYITTTLPYVNADPHIGHALEFTRADIIARYKKLNGYEVFFNTGTDEHGLKIYRKALAEGKKPEEYVDEYAKRFRNFVKRLNIIPNFNFIRTSDSHHVESAREFWRVCKRSGDIYKKNYNIKYCVGCELEKTESDLENGKCPDHPNGEIEIIEEENYFFRFSKYSDKLLDLYNKNPEFVLPSWRMNEIKSFVERGLEDFSISRLKIKMPWGVEVPDDPDHVMYVWFDALVNYVTAIGWPNDKETFNKWWPVTQYCGKDNLRQQSAMWQAMLLSAGLPNSKKVIVNGFIISGGVKMSKSIGNVIDPIKIIDEYDIDPLRYFLAREISNFEDGDFTIERFKEIYNANLANGLGNLVSRLMKLAESHLSSPVDLEDVIISDEYFKYMDNFDINKASDFVWQRISEIDKSIQKIKPWELIKNDKDKGEEAIKNLVKKLYEISYLLWPIMPETSEKITFAIKENKSPGPLFLRK